MTAEPRVLREQIIAHLTRLVLRRRLLRTQIWLEVAAAIAGGSTCIAFGVRSRAALATAGLASLASFLAAQDLRRLRTVGAQIAALARIVAAFV